VCVQFVESVADACKGADRSAMRRVLQPVLTAQVSACGSEKSGDILVSFVSNIRACIFEATKLPEGVEVAVGEGVGEWRCGITDGGPAVVRTTTVSTFRCGAGRTRVVESRRHVELLTIEEVDALTAALVQLQQDSLQRRAVRAAERDVHKDDFDEEELEAEQMKDASEEEIGFHVRPAPCSCCVLRPLVLTPCDVALCSADCRHPLHPCEGARRRILAHLRAPSARKDVYGV
jgi:hypothetical protein